MRKIHLNNGTVIVGRIIHSNPNYMYVQSEGRELTIPLWMISAVDQSSDGEEAQPLKGWDC